MVGTTALHVAPGAQSEVVQTLRDGEQVKLFGTAKGAWVRVQPFTAVVPGWVYAADLRPLPGTIRGGPVITETLALSVTATVTPSTTLLPTTPLPDARRPRPTALPTAVRATAEVEQASADATMAGAEQASVEITVDILEASVPFATPGKPGATPMTRIGIAGMRVQVVNVFGDILLEAVTPSSGEVSFTREIAPETAVYVQVPALGLRAQLPADEVAAGKTRLAITVPSPAG